MNSFDHSIVSFLNSFTRHSFFFDTFVSMLSDNLLLKGGVVCALVWWGWFRTASPVSAAAAADKRQSLLSGMFACLLAVIVARTLASTLPFRPRPMSNSALHFVFPYDFTEHSLISWSSFPSDHAALFFALAMAIWFVWRAAGIVALCHVAIFICVPRIYLGIHYPTDILGGALIGISAALLAQIHIVRNSVGKALLPWLDRSPGSFYACMFIFTFQLATLFDGVRYVGRFLYHLSQPNLAP